MKTIDAASNPWKRYSEEQPKNGDRVIWVPPFPYDLEMAIYKDGKWGDSVSVHGDGCDVKCRPEDMWMLIPPLPVTNKGE